MRLTICCVVVSRLEICFYFLLIFFKKFLLPTEATINMFRRLTTVISLWALCNAKTVSVTDFGAIGDGKSMNTKAFRAASSSLTGGGTLVVPTGSFVTGPFNLTSGTTLEVHGTVLGADDLNEYPIIAPLPSYGISRDFNVHNRYQPLVMTYNVTNIKIIGVTPTAAIDGQGDYWWKLKKDNTLQYGRPRLIELMWTDGIVVTGIELRNPGFWNLHPIYSSNIHIYNVSFIAPSSSPNTDGIDPDSSNNVLIEHNTFSVGDDFIAIKSGIDEFGRKVNIPTRNVTIRYNKMYSGHGLSIGSEISGGVEDVHVYNNTIFGPAEVAFRIKTAPSRGGFIRNVKYENNIVGDASTAMGISTTYSSSPPVHVLTDLRNISYDGIYRINKTDSSIKAGSFECFPKPAIGCNDLHFNNINLQDTDSQWSCKNVNTSTVHNVKPDGLSKCLSDS